MSFTMLRKNKIWRVDLVRSCDTSSYHIWNRISLCVDTDFFFRRVVFHPRETLVFEPEKSLVYNKRKFVTAISHGKNGLLCDKLHVTLGVKYVSFLFFFNQIFLIMILLIANQLIILETSEGENDKQAKGTVEKEKVYCTNKGRS